jgi:diaminohydroxyphosphoribosylaminopyrimidine deaminase/5-amino-6-(5-phosphoribosylamino)uracil reductase
VCGPEALELLAPFGKWTTTGRPLVTLKLAMSLDGRIADRRGAARWISGRAARRFGQDVRRTADAILVGAGTVRADNPSLLPRPAHGRKPYRVIVVGRRRIPSGSRVLNDTDAERTILAVAGSRPRGLAAASRRGARVVRFGASRRVPLARLMKKLGAMGCLHVLCEGGGSLAESLVREGLVDRLLLIYAPCFIGGDGAPAGVRGSGWLIDRLPRVRIGSVERLGSDVLVRAEPLRR